MRVRPDPEFLSINKLSPDHTIGLDAKVVTGDEFAGMTTVVVPGRTPLNYVKLDGVLPPPGVKPKRDRKAPAPTNGAAAAEPDSTAIEAAPLESSDGEDGKAAGPTSAGSSPGKSDAQGGTAGRTPRPGARPKKRKR